MTEFVSLSSNWPFSAALLLMLLLALLEVVGMIMGAGLSDLLDSLIPDFDADAGMEADIDSDVDVAHTSSLGNLLAWLRIGEIPSVISLSILLALFGLLGYLLQASLIRYTGSPMTPLAASMIVLPLSLPALRVVSGWVGHIIPDDQTESVSIESFVGQTAQVIIGDAEHQSPAQAKLTDSFGQTHYIMVEPDLGEPAIKQGSTVILLERQDSTFLAKQRNTA